MVFLTILFCSGGSWWYRIRNHEYTSRGPQVLSPRVTVYSGAIQNQSYPTINPGALPMQNTQYQCPPPPYYGPPPSYDTAVNQVQAPIRQGWYCNGGTFLSVYLCFYHFSMFITVSKDLLYVLNVK